MAKAKTKPKRGPGRPRSAPKPEGLDRTACAHHFNVPVKTVDKWLREGVPVTRHNGRVYFDPVKVEAWREDYEAQQREPAQAAVLHPSDPRFQEKEAAARVKLYTHALEVGYMVRIEDLRPGVADAFAHLNSMVSTIPAIVGDLTALNRTNAESVLGPAVEHVLSDFKPDHVRNFPEPREIVHDEPEPDEFEERNYMPVLSSGPQAAIARANARRHLAELDTLQRSCITVVDVRRMLAEKCNAIRAELRAMPAKIAARLAPGDNSREYVRACIHYESDVARIALGGKYPPPPADLDPDNPEHKKVLDFFAALKPVPPDADEPVKAVDGLGAADEFEEA